MEYKEALAILIKLQDKHSLGPEEKEAILTAIGVLDMASIAKKSWKNRIKAIKEKREKDTQ
jgi:hypothetical protein